MHTRQVLYQLSQWLSGFCPVSLCFYLHPSFVIYLGEELLCSIKRKYYIALIFGKYDLYELSIILVCWYDLFYIAGVRSWILGLWTLLWIFMCIFKKHNTIHWAFIFTYDLEHVQNLVRYHYREINGKGSHCCSEALSPGIVCGYLPGDEICPPS